MATPSAGRTRNCTSLRVPQTDVTVTGLAAFCGSLQLSPVMTQRSSRSNRPRSAGTRSTSTASAAPRLTSVLSDARSASDPDDAATERNRKLWRPRNEPVLDEPEPLPLDPHHVPDPQPLRCRVRRSPLDLGEAAGAVTRVRTTADVPPTAVPVPGRRARGGPEACASDLLAGHARSGRPVLEAGPRRAGQLLPLLR